MERERARLRVCRGRADPSFRQAGARFVRLRFLGMAHCRAGRPPQSVVALERFARRRRARFWGRALSVAAFRC